MKIKHIFLIYVYMFGWDFFLTRITFEQLGFELGTFWSVALNFQLVVVRCWQDASSSFEL